MRMVVFDYYQGFMGRYRAETISVLRGSIPKQRQLDMEMIEESSRTFLHSVGVERYLCFALGMRYPFASEMALKLFQISFNQLSPKLSLETRVV